MTDKRRCVSLPAALCVVALAAGPAGAQYHVYWGDMHGHTAISDGKGSLDDYFTYARDTSKLDFVIVTDHDFGNAGPWRMPKETWTLTQDKADEYTSGGKFVAIAGYEWTSQSKYWTPEEPLFRGPVKNYNHKNVYFPSRVEYLLSAKDAAYNNPNLLAEAVRKHGGLIHNCHPDQGPEGRDQFDYDPSCYSVIVNTEMAGDIMRYRGKTHDVHWETIVRGFLNRGGKTGFVRGTDTHEGKPAARTAVVATELTRPAIFDALRHRRNYAISHARIDVEFKIDGHWMGEEIEVEGKPRITANIRGTDKINEAAIIRDGTVIHSVNPNAENAHVEFQDDAFADKSYYYLRVTQVDADEHGNPSSAWVSPIWVRKKSLTP
jgi:hypothetical protein